MDDPRAFETQETGEGRIEAAESARELEEATFEPEARVERGESIEQAEAIEAAFVEAVSAGTTDEISATPITLPNQALDIGDGEISATPIPLTKQATETGGDEISATPIPLSSGARETLNEEISTAPRPIPGSTERFEDTNTPSGAEENADTDMDQTSGGREQVEAIPITIPYPRPEGELAPETMQGGSEQVEAIPITIPYPRPEGELAPETLQGGSEQVESIAATPQPIPETAERAESTAATPQPIPETAERVDGFAETLPDDTLAGVTGEGEPGLEPAINVPGEAMEESEATFSEQLAGLEGDTVASLEPDAEQIGDVQEYWEPPEMYIYRAPDGSVMIVDANGKPIDSPPIIQSAPDGDMNKPFYGWYPGSDPSEGFEIPLYEPPLEDMYAYVGKDGTVTIVDKDGKPVDSPPQVFMDSEGDIHSAGPDGSKVGIPIYQSPVEDVYAYVASDGSVMIVDSDGKPVYSPPFISSAGEEGKYFTAGPDGSKLEIPLYTPPTEGIYAYTAQDGTVQIVDENGNLVPCPPMYMRDAEMDTVFIKDASGAKIDIPPYTPATEGVYAYTAQDGSVTLVDENGKPVQCPPWYMHDPEMDEVFTKTPEGTKVDIPAFTPKLEGVYAYAAPDGSVQVVGADGKPIDSPPHIQKIVDGSGQVHIYASYPGLPTEGPPVELTYYKPVSAHFKQ